MDLYTELRALIEVLKRESIEYALCGGLAVAFHGYVRFTHDIDLLIQEKDVENCTAVLQEYGFLDSSGRMSLGDVVLYRLLKTDGTDHLTLDLIVLHQGDQDVWDGRELFDWESVPIWVVSAEGLAKMKRRAGRDQDLLDLKKLGLADEGESDASNEGR